MIRVSLSRVLPRNAALTAALHFRLNPARLNPVPQLHPAHQQEHLLYCHVAPQQLAVLLGVRLTNYPSAMVWQGDEAARLSTSTLTAPFRIWSQLVHVMLVPKTLIQGFEFMIVAVKVAPAV